MVSNKANKTCIQGKVITRFISALALTIAECAPKAVIAISRKLYNKYGRLEDLLSPSKITLCDNITGSVHLLLSIGCNTERIRASHIIEVEKKCSKDARQIRVEKKGQVYLVKQSGRVLARLIVTNQLKLADYVIPALHKNVLELIREYIETYGPDKLSSIEKYIAKSLGLDRRRVRSILEQLVSLEYASITAGYITWVDTDTS